MATTTPLAPQDSPAQPKTTQIAAILGALLVLAAGVAAGVASYSTFVRALTCKTAGLTTEMQMHLKVDDVEFYRARCLDGTTHTAWLPATAGALGVAALAMLVLVVLGRVIYMFWHAVKVTQPGYSGYHYPVISYHVDVIMYYLLWSTVLCIGAALILHDTLAGK